MVPFILAHDGDDSQAGFHHNSSEMPVSRSFFPVKTTHFLQFSLRLKICSRAFFPICIICTYVFKRRLSYRNMYLMLNLLSVNS